jgi:hypothetical protein
MAGGMTNATAAAYIDDSVGTSARTAPTTPMKLAATTNAPTTSTAGTEFASTTRPSVAFGAATGTPPVASSTGTTTVTVGGSGTATGVDAYDSAGTPVRKWFGQLSATRALVAGDSIAFAAGALTLSLTSP